MATINGQCHCKKNTFSLKAKPSFQITCFCTDCRVLNGGGHLCGISFEASALNAAPATKIYRYTGGSGREIESHFCFDCGTHLYAYPTAHPNVVVVKANTLLDFEFKADKELFKESAFSWDAKSD